MADHTVIGAQNLCGSPADVSASDKAPEGWRSPRRFAHQEIVLMSDRSWSAAAFRRFFWRHNRVVLTENGSQN
jgi:hypothetical protein